MDPTFVVSFKGNAAVYLHDMESFNSFLVDFLPSLCC